MVLRVLMGISWVFVAFAWLNPVISGFRRKRQADAVCHDWLLMVGAAALNCLGLQMAANLWYGNEEAQRLYDETLEIHHVFGAVCGGWAWALLLYLPGRAAREILDLVHGLWSQWRSASASSPS